MGLIRQNPFSAHLEHLCKFENPRAILLQLAKLLLCGANEEFGVVDVHAADVDNGVVSVVANFILIARHATIALLASTRVLALLAVWAAI